MSIELIFKPVRQTRRRKKQLVPIRGMKNFEGAIIFAGFPESVPDERKLTLAGRWFDPTWTRQVGTRRINRPDRLPSRQKTVGIEPLRMK